MGVHGFVCLSVSNTASLKPCKVIVLVILFGRFFCYFLVYGSSDLNFCILKKKKDFIFDFFISSNVKNCQI